MTEERPKPESAEHLLADWRSAERDTVGARNAAEIAALALAAAEAAEEAATEVEAAADAAGEAVERARTAAARARRAASDAADAAKRALASAEGDKSRANHDVERAKAAEQLARDRFHSAEDEGFPKRYGGSFWPEPENETCPPALAATHG